MYLTYIGEMKVSNEKTAMVLFGENYKKILKLSPEEKNHQDYLKYIFSANEKKIGNSNKNKKEKNQNIHMLM